MEHTPLPSHRARWPFSRTPSLSSPFGASSTAEQVTHGIDASHLTAIVTGGTSGIGEETARILALRGARVVIAARNVAAGEKVKSSILKEISHARIHVLEMDLSSLISVKKFVDEFNSLNVPLNILINNAGVMACPFQLSADGIEIQFATNHIGHFLLTDLLLTKLKATAQETGKEGRIVNVSSNAHFRTYSEGLRLEKLNDKSSYSPFSAYGQSKLANILHANELAKRLQKEGANVTINSLHPGVILTNIVRHFKILGKVLFLASVFFKSIPQGAATQCYLSLHPTLKGVTGKYFSDCKEANPSAFAKDSNLAIKLWDYSDKVTCGQKK